MKHFVALLKRLLSPAGAFALALVTLVTTAGCATSKKDPSPEKPPVEGPVDLEVDARKAAYLRDIRPRIVTYDGNFSDMETPATTSLEEEFSTGEFIPRSDLF